MLIQETKIFRDSIHGYISIPVDYVNNFIDTELFQRLRGIEQTGMRILYPSARHDRFIHSLGTFYLGHKAFICFYENIKRSYASVKDGKGDYYHIFSLDEKNIAFWDYCQLLFELACLLHDCGHAPFSHTFEYLYDIEQIEGSSSLKTKLKEYIGSKEFGDDFMGNGSPHERMSGLLVCTDFKDAIERLLNTYGLMDNDFGNPIEFVVRMIIGCTYNNQTIKKNQIKNCFIELLNSKSIDMDSLDYIIRDAKLSGIDNMNIDVDWLLSSLTLIEITEFDNCMFHSQELATNILDGELKENGHKAKITGKFRGRLKINDGISGTIGGTVDIEGSIRPQKNIEVQEEDNNRAEILINGVRHGKMIPAIEEQANVKIRGTLKEKLPIKGSSLSADIETNSEVQLEAKEYKFSATYLESILEGRFTGVLLGNYSQISGAKVKCVLGFHKSSLSVIQNVVIARNYEYQWIYSHHKVVYYANYLLIDLFKNCVQFLLQKQENEKPREEDKREITIENVDRALADILCWNTMINHSYKEEEFHSYLLDAQPLHRVSDADILAIFNKCRLLKGKSDQLNRQLKEYYNRKYKKSLWKSYAEFHIFFSQFTQSEKTRIFKCLQEHSFNNLNGQYGFLKENWAKEFSKCGLNNVVWVNGDSKLKTLNPDNTYILFKDCALTYRTISSANDIRPMEKLNLFYIYYEPVNSFKGIDREGLLGFIKEELRKGSK